MDNRPIGVFDSGVGGVSVLKQLINTLPSEDYIYLGDTARVPYGGKSTESIQSYARECTIFLLSQDVKMIVIACNTVSSLAVDVVKSVASNIDIIEMILPATKGAVKMSITGKIGVIGTKATISSDAYKEAILRTKKVEVFSRACPLFVPLVEEGKLENSYSKQIAEEYLSGFTEHGVDTLVLGCTHYPFLKKLIQSTLPDVKLIDTGEQAAIQTLEILKGNNASNSESTVGNVSYFVTDDTFDFKSKAEQFLNMTIERVEKIDITS